MGRVAQLLKQADLLLAGKSDGVHHILPSGERASQQAVALLDLVPLVHFEFTARHAVACAGGEALCAQKSFLVEAVIPDESHHVDGGEVAHAVAVEQNLAARVAAAEVGAAFEARLLVDPAASPEYRICCRCQCSCSRVGLRR